MLNRRDVLAKITGAIATAGVAGTVEAVEKPPLLFVMTPDNHLPMEVQHSDGVV